MITQKSEELICQVPLWHTILSTDVSPVTDSINMFFCFNEEGNGTHHGVSLLSPEIIDNLQSWEHCLLPWKRALSSELGFESQPLHVVLAGRRQNRKISSTQMFPGLQEDESWRTWLKLGQKLHVFMRKVTHIPRTVGRGGVHLWLGSAGNCLGTEKWSKLFNWEVCSHLYGCCCCTTVDSIGQLATLKEEIQITILWENFPKLEEEFLAW